MEINFERPPLTRLNSARSGSHRNTVSTTALLLKQANLVQTKELRSISSYLYKEYVTNKSQKEMIGVCLSAQKLEALTYLQGICSSKDYKQKRRNAFTRTLQRGHQTHRAQNADLQTLNWKPTYKNSRNFNFILNEESSVDFRQDSLNEITEEGPSTCRGMNNFQETL